MLVFLINPKFESPFLQGQGFHPLPHPFDYAQGRLSRLCYMSKLDFLIF